MTEQSISMPNGQDVQERTNVKTIAAKVKFEKGITKLGITQDDPRYEIIKDIVYIAETNNIEYDMTTYHSRTVSQLQHYLENYRLQATPKPPTAIPPAEEPAEESVSNSPAFFGPILDPDSKRIYGLVSTGIMPPRIKNYVYEILGVPIREEGEVYIWRLKQPLESKNTEWSILRDALEWHMGAELGFVWTTTDLLDNGNFIEMKLSDDGPMFNWSKDSKANILIKDYRAYREGLARGEEKRSHFYEVNGFQRLMNRTWAQFEQSDLSPVSRIALLAILKKCQSAKQCNLSQEDIASKAGCSVRTLQRTAIPELENGKWIRVKKNKHMDIDTYIILRTELLPPYVQSKKK